MRSLPGCALGTEFALFSQNLYLGGWIAGASSDQLFLKDKFVIRCWEHASHGSRMINHMGVIGEIMNLVIVHNRAPENKTDTVISC